MVMALVYSYKPKYWRKIALMMTQGEKLGVTKAITDHKRNMNVCNTFHGNPSNR